MSLKRWIIGTASILGLSIVALAAVAIYANVGRANGVEFGSMDSPEAAFPVAVGFGSMWFIAISAIVLVVLVLISIVRANSSHTRA
jgi:heme/copper-type cytochrome/quinol oxidase subunit 2